MDLGSLAALGLVVKRAVTSLCLDALQLSVNCGQCQIVIITKQLFDLMALCRHLNGQYQRDP